MDGWFSINRQLLESDRWIAEPFTRGQAWVDLIGLARHKDGYFRIRGIKVELKRGQLAWSQLSLSKRWMLSRGKTRRYLNELEKHQDIVQQNNEVTTLITILKYEYWQHNGTTSSTTDGQQTDNKRYTNNNGNNGKKENKEYIYTTDFQTFYDAYPKKVEKKKAFAIWQRKQLKNYTAEIIDFISKAKETKQWREGYVPNPTTFLNGERWEDDLSSYGKNREVVSFK